MNHLAVRDYRDLDERDVFAEDRKLDSTGLP
jgi:hypothetical protein